MALREAGLDPREQPVAGCGGANVVATIPGDVDRWIVIGAHHDHLGRWGGRIHPGADDNAAAVAILVDVAGALVRSRPSGRGVIVVSFDGEEPPHFLTDGMGSERFAREPIVPMDRIDFMVCMDLVGHAIGGPELPAVVQDTVFAIGSERSAGTAADVDRLADVVHGVSVRRLDAELIPPLSDYEPFWRRRVPFLFLTSGRTRRYHTPDDVPAHLDWGKMSATARWVEGFAREACARDGPSAFTDLRDDASNLTTLAAMCEALGPISQEAEGARRKALSLFARCDRDGRLPEDLRFEMQMLAGMLEARLA